MTPIEMKRMKVEYHKVLAGRLDIELRVEEVKETVRKLEESIEASMRRENEIQEILNQEQAK